MEKTANESGQSSTETFGESESRCADFHHREARQCRSVARLDTHKHIKSRIFLQLFNEEIEQVDTAERQRKKYPIMAFLEHVCDSEIAWYFQFTLRSRRHRTRFSGSDFSRYFSRISSLEQFSRRT